jgi:hypothetical protein
VLRTAPDIYIHSLSFSVGGDPWFLKLRVNGDGDGDGDAVPSGVHVRSGAAAAAAAACFLWFASWQPTLMMASDAVESKAKTKVACPPPKRRRG